MSDVVENAAVRELPAGFAERGPLPHLFWPRSYQAKCWADYERGIRRFITVWPRRGGKDQHWLNFSIARAAETPGTYAHIFPELGQGKRIIWDELTGGGFSFLEHFREDFCKADGRRGRNESELTVEMRNGSIYRILGCDYADRIRGLNLLGAVFSEAQMMTRAPWSIVEPMMAQNGGWAAFNGTPDGRSNLLYQIWMESQGEEGWHRSKYTVDDVFRDGVAFKKNPATGEYTCEPEDGSRLVTQEYLDGMRRRAQKSGRLKDIEEWIQQEFYCSFNTAKAGSYYAEQLRFVRDRGQITRVPYDPRFPVETAWDLGHADLMAVWWFQNIHGAIHCIDYHEEAGQSVPYFIELAKAKGYRYRAHWAPHDIKQHDPITGKSRIEAARELGVFFRVVPFMGVQDGVEAVRQLLPRCYFDEQHCDAGIAALENYHSEFSERLDMRKPQAVHDRWSHGADAFRYLATIADMEQDTEERGEVRSETEFDPLAS